MKLKNKGNVAINKERRKYKSVIGSHQRTI